MYEFTIDGEKLYYQGDPESVVLSPQIEVKMNEAGKAQMTVPPINPLYSSIKNRKSMLSVKKNNREIFYGEVRSYERGFDMGKSLVAVGVLSFLNDSRQPQVNYGNITIRQFLTNVLNIHNQQMFDDDRKKIYLGYTTVENTSNLVDKITDNQSTLEAIRDNLIEVHGGVLRIRHTNNLIYLDYITLSEYGEFCTQGITLGDNLMDYVENFNAENVKTVIRPHGARIEGDTDSEFEQRVDIKSVNGGLDYIVGSTTAINNYGYVWDDVTYDGIDSPSTLKTMGQTYLRETQFERAVFNLSAADLAAVDASMSPIYFGDRINVKVPMVGLDATYPIIEMIYKPQNPEDERIVVSANLRTNKVSITGRLNNASREAIAIAEKATLKMKQVLEREIANIMATFSGQYGGYKLSEYDSNGLWLRDLYMDAPDKDDATNIMEFSMRGIRFSTAGYKAPTDPAWKLAITIDGKIASQEIFSNIIFANLLKAGIIQDVAGNTSWNLETGALSSRKFSISSTNFQLAESGSVTMADATITNGDITTFSGNKSMTLRDGVLKGYINGVMQGEIDISPTYVSGDKVLALYGVDYLELQAGPISNNMPIQRIVVDRDGIHPQGMTGTVTIGGDTVELDGGLIMDVY